jgi:hypothetical protein
MKKTLIVLIIWLLLTANAGAVIVTGTGENKVEAINNGLRDAVEMFTSVLVYSVTDVENFQIQKDQIVSASSGYVKNYKIIKTSTMDELIIVTLDVEVSEEKIKNIIRANVKMMTYQEILKDLNNVTKRQEQIKSLTKMLTLLASRKISENYGVIYEGYEIKRIGATKVDVILSIRITENPFYHDIYNGILKDLSDASDSFETKLMGGDYRRDETGKLVNTRYYVAKDAEAPSLEVKAQIYVGKIPVDSCRVYQDNIMMEFDALAFAGGFVRIIPGLVMQAYDKEDPKVDEKYYNIAIQKSKIIPPEGLPMKIRIVMLNSKDVPKLSNLKLSLGACKSKQ